MREDGFRHANLFLHLYQEEVFHFMEQMIGTLMAILA